MPIVDWNDNGDTDYLGISRIYKGIPVPSSCSGKDIDQLHKQTTSKNKLRFDIAHHRLFQTPSPTSLIFISSILYRTFPAMSVLIQSQVVVTAAAALPTPPSSPTSSPQAQDLAARLSGRTIRLPSLKKSLRSWPAATSEYLPEVRQMVDAMLETYGPLNATSIMAMPILPPFLFLLNRCIE